MKPNRVWCRNFLIVTGSLFVLGAVLYGALWRVGGAYAVPTPAPPLAVVGLMGGWLLAGTAGGILLFARWVRGRGTLIKVLCAVLFPLTLCALYMAGMFGVLPMAVYCIVYIHRHKNEPAPPPPAPLIYYPPIRPPADETPPRPQRG